MINWVAHAADAHILGRQEQPYRMRFNIDASTKKYFEKLCFTCFKLHMRWYIINVSNK